MTENLSASNATIAELVSELRVFGVTLRNIDEKLNESMQESRDIRKIVHHLDKNAATKAELHDIQKNLHIRIDKVQAAQEESWKKFILYIALSGGAGGVSAGGLEFLKVMFGG